ncbi:ATP-binding protein [Mycoplana dimorpha]|uniref:histidine kinase n=1 Tax=Mycoplana dimorpha TaxID=28320 RepID=A0A2T5BFI5_MYCDI|nr:ATP-binding protein [Mycoplana dimorpha]PTM97749.1 PAS/PAC sensor signal transduction histidine kinase [Mycoplana dimorpha]
MSAHQYPFIDVAVHERVRLPFARGDAVVLFSTDMRDVLWANGRGAALFGHASIYDFLEAPTPGDVVFRQLAAAARQIPHKGIGRNLLLRIGPNFRGQPMTVHVERITLAPDEDAILFCTAIAAKDEPAAERAASLLDGFDDPDTHMAVLDGEGGIIAASAGFTGLGISQEARRRMVEAAQRERDGLVKRPVPTGKGLLPAALGRISAEPPLNLLLAVETILGHMDAEQEPTATATAPAAQSAPSGAVPEASAAPVAVQTAAPVAALPQEMSKAIAQEEPGEDQHRQALPASADDAAGTDAGKSGDNPPAATESEARTPLEPAPAVSASTGDDSRFVFNPATRPVRFVWKIDAEGVFSEVSDEFARVVGPHSAAVIGMPFVEVAHRFDFDADGVIANLLRRRDTWSGKTILWPVEGTSLAVPVDLAALPTYSRNREFDGFRGFGIVRVADVVEDPDARGLKLGGLAAATEQADEATAGETATAEAPALPAAGAEDPAQTPPPAPSVLDALLAGEQEEETAAPSDSPAGSLPDADNAADESDDEFRGERPALRLVEPDRRASDKIVQLDDRRGRPSALTTGEQAAFREIARHLGKTFGKRRPEDTHAASDAEPGPPAAAPPEAHKAAASDFAAEVKRAGEDGTGPHAPAEAGHTAPADAREESPGLEIGDHADDIPTRTAPIVAPRVSMEYGLTAAVVDALPVALLIHAGDRLIHANPEFLDLTGFNSLSELERAGGLEALLDRPEADDREHPGTMLLRHADGVTVVPVRARLQSVRWESGSALMLALSPTGASVADAPAPEMSAAAASLPHEQEAETLRNEAIELRSILETATDGVVIVGHDGEIRSINRSASALFNYDEDDIRGRPFALLFAHESQKAVLDYLAGLSGHGVASVLNDGREVIGREASGGFIPLFMTMGRLSSSSGYCAVIRDITQWKRTEEELRNAKRAAETANAHKSDFLARVSHEIRTPLNAIIGFSDMMASERFGPIGHPRYVEYANDIGRSGRHVLDIVNDLLDISKIEAGEMELDFTAVGLNETVSEAVALVQPHANSQRVIIRTSLSTAVPPVVADLRSIKQIALNILTNAIRFTPSGGQIVVSTAYEPNGSVVLRIRDTGVGMTRSELEQAMKPFRQVTTGARKRGDGTGLGLPLTKAMVDANRASFAISSSPNQGTLVEVTFPSPRVLAV